MCHASRTEECKEPTCPSKRVRADRLARAQGKKDAKGRKGKPKPAQELLSRVGGPTPDQILQLDAKEVAKLELRQIFMLPEVYMSWINGEKTKAGRSERHRQLFEALRDTYLDSSARETGDGTGSKLSKFDHERARRDLARLRDLADPATSAATRVENLVQKFGYDMVAYKDAQTHGWPAVRKAQAVFASEAQVSRGWAQALSKGVAQAKAASTSQPARQGRGRGKGKGGGKKGGGGGGKGDAAAGGGGGGQPSGSQGGRR